MILFALIWIEIGAIVWAFMDGAGIIADRFAPRRANSRAPTLLLISATIAVILAWPWFVWIRLKGVYVSLRGLWSLHR